MVEEGLLLLEPCLLQVEEVVVLLFLKNLLAKDHVQDLHSIPHPHQSCQTTLLRVLPHTPILNTPIILF